VVCQCGEGDTQKWQMSKSEAGSVIFPIQFLRHRSPWLTVTMFVSIFCSPLTAQNLQKETLSDDIALSTFASPLSTDSSDSTSASPASSDGQTTTTNVCDVTQLGTCLRDFLGDQAAIWSSPARIRPHDALWLLPLAAATAVSVNYDVQTLQQVSTSPSRIRVSNDLSNAGAYGAIAVAGATYAIGKFTHNETARETGVLSLEAIADSGLVTEVLKLATNRERPYMGTGQGRFWPDGTNLYTTNGSFPSEHATIIWAFSHVVADETPGHRWLHLGIYALAAGVSAARVTSRNHFPSDVVVGSAIGYLVGGYVYRRHSESYCDNTPTSVLTVSPAYDAATRSYGMGITIDPVALRGGHLKPK
jgi:hypothetical protein